MLRSIYRMLYCISVNDIAVWQGAEMATMATASAQKGASTQMNTRIGVELKAQGDAVFARLGLSASQAVRKFYEFAASCAGEPEKLERVVLDAGLDKSTLDEREQRIVRRRALVEQGAALFENALSRMGTNASFDGFSECVNLPYEDLRELALLDRFDEEGIDQ